MMIGRLPTVHIPQWDPLPDPTPTTTTTTILSPSAYASALLDSDDFRMYEFKIRRCVRGRSHDWTDCPFAHPGEKARRRDPRRHPYSGSPCPDFRKGSCKKGDSCEFSHGVFECWLHPARYRTQPCKDGVHCTRRVCFFAHTPDQLRVVADQDSSPPVSPDSLSGLMRGLRIGFTSPRCYQVSLTPTRLFDAWGGPVEEEPAMERVESGKDLRAAMYAKLRRENSMDRAEPVSVPGPDFGWVAELVK